MTGLARTNRGATVALNRRRRRAEILQDLAAELEITPAELAIDRKPAPTVVEAVTPWLNTLAVGKPKPTILTYRTGMHRFCEFLRVEALDPATTPTNTLPGDILERFVVALNLAFPDGKQTVATYIGGAKSFFRWLFRRSWGPVDSSYELMNLGLKEVMGRFDYRSRKVDSRLPELIRRVVVVPPKPPWRASRVTGAREREALLIVLRDRAMMLMMYTSGLRVSELVSLDRTVLEEEVPTVVGKGRKERVIFICDPVRDELRAYLEARDDNSPALFLSHHRSGGHGQARRGAARPDNRLTQQGVGVIVKGHGQRAGIVATPHLFRHRFATDLLASGASMSEVSEILGHASVAVTHKVYAHHSVGHLKAAYSKYASKLKALVPPAK